jgi:predicted membrane protein
MPICFPYLLLNLMLVLLCSGRLIRTFADVKYGNYHLTAVEIIYNIISFIIAVVTTVAFTVYAKRALKDLEKEEATEEVPPTHQESHEMRKLPLERPKHAGLSSFSL